MTAKDEEKKVSTHPDVPESEGELIFGPGMDGMGTFTAKPPLTGSCAKN